MPGSCLSCLFNVFMPHSGISGRPHPPPHTLSLPFCQPAYRYRYNLVLCSTYTTERPPEQNAGIATTTAYPPANTTAHRHAPRYLPAYFTTTHSCRGFFGTGCSYDCRLTGAGGVRLPHTTPPHPTPTTPIPRQRAFNAAYYA